MWRSVLLTLSLVACGGADDKPAPTCQQAMAHFYGVNCSYFDGRVDPPHQYTQAEMITVCQDLAIETSASCQGTIDDWLECNDTVAGIPAGQTSGLGDPRCDCSQEQMAILRCN